jgi:Right handed beta helix region
MKGIATWLFVLAFILLAGNDTRAQSFTTYVSSNGNDTHVCSRSAPCATFSGALKKTQEGGEIIVLDAGDYGSVTITQALTIDGRGLGGISPTGAIAIQVSAGPRDIVTLRNLDLNGVGKSVTGVVYLSGGALEIDHCIVSNFTDGMDLGGTGLISILDTVVSDNTGSGVNVSGHGGRVDVLIDKSRFEHNGVVGVLAEEFSRVTVRDSDASENGIGFLAQASGGDVRLNIINSTANHNTTGIQAGDGIATGNSLIRLSGVSIMSNIVDGLKIKTGGVIESFGNNYNSGTGKPTFTSAPQ